MTPRKAVGASAAPPELPALPAPPPDRTPTDERREQQLEELLQAIGTDGRVAVYNDGKYAGVMPIEGFTMETLLDAYGGGDKSLVIYQGQRKVETVRVQLDPELPATSPRQRKLEESRARGAGPGQGPGADTAGMMATFMTAQMQSMQATQQMMTGMVTAVTTLMAAKPDRDPMDVALQMARLLKEGAPAPGAGVGAGEVLSLLKEGIGMGKLLSNGGSDDDGTLGVVKEGLGIVGKIVDAQAQQAAHAQRAGPGSSGAASVGSADAGRRLVGPGVERQIGADDAARPPSDGRAGVGGVPGPVDDDASGRGAAHGAGPSMSDGPLGGRPWVLAVGDHFNALAAMSGWMAPATAAAAISDRLDDEAFSDLLDDMQDATPPGFGGRLRAAYPVAATIRPEWLEELATILLTQFSQEDTGEDGEDVHDGEQPGGPAPAGDDVTGAG